MRFIVTIDVRPGASPVSAADRGKTGQYALMVTGAASAQDATGMARAHFDAQVQLNAPAALVTHADATPMPALPGTRPQEPRRVVWMEWPEPACAD